MTVGQGIFSGCTSLVSVTLSTSMTIIPNSFFGGCSSIASFTIPPNILTLGNSCFSSCTGLTTFTIPNTVTMVEQSVFANCTSLTNITLSSSLTIISAYCFYNCSQLSNVTFGNSQNIVIVENNAFFLTKDGITVRYKNAYSFNDLPLSLQNSQDQFTNPTFIYDAKIQNYLSTKNIVKKCNKNKSIKITLLGHSNII